VRVSGFSNGALDIIIFIYEQVKQIVVIFFTFMSSGLVLLRMWELCATYFEPFGGMRLVLGGA
jgi:hypothetical protein